MTPISYIQSILRLLYVNRIDGDTLVPCLARTSACLLSTTWVYRIIVFYVEGFQQPASWQLREKLNMQIGYNNNNVDSTPSNLSQIAKFMGPTWGPPGSCRPQMGPCWPHEPCYQGRFQRNSSLAGRSQILSTLHRSSYKMYSMVNLHVLSLMTVGMGIFPSHAVYLFEICQTSRQYCYRDRLQMTNGIFYDIVALCVMYTIICNEYFINRV